MIIDLDKEHAEATATLSNNTKAINLKHKQISLKHTIDVLIRLSVCAQGSDRVQINNQIAEFNKQIKKIEQNGTK